MRVLPLLSQSKKKKHRKKPPPASVCMGHSWSPASQGRGRRGSQRSKWSEDEVVHLQQQLSSRGGARGSGRRSNSRMDMDLFMSRTFWFNLIRWWDDDDNRRFVFPCTLSFLFPRNSITKSNPLYLIFFVSSRQHNQGACKAVVHLSLLLLLLYGLVLNNVTCHKELLLWIQFPLWFLVLHCVKFHAVWFLQEAQEQNFVSVTTLYSNSSYPWVCVGSSEPCSGLSSFPWAWIRPGLNLNQSISFLV